MIESETPAEVTPEAEAQAETAEASALDVLTVAAAEVTPVETAEAYSLETPAAEEQSEERAQEPAATAEETPAEIVDTENNENTAETETPAAETPEVTEEPVAEPAAEETPAENIEEEAAPSAEAGTEKNTEDTEDTTVETSEEATDENTEETPVEIAMPAMTLEEKTDDLTTEDPDDKLVVRVEAEKGTFPEGTTMKVTPVVDEKVINKITDEANAKTEENVAVKTVQAVDITFYDAAQNKIEPKKQIRVTMTSALVKETDEQMIVHVDDKGKAEVVEHLDEDAQKAKNIEAAEDEIIFEADKFSVYAIVGTESNHHRVHHCQWRDI